MSFRSDVLLLLHCYSTVKKKDHIYSAVVRFDCEF